MAHVRDLSKSPLRERRAGLRRRVINWFRREARDFPWRGVADPYVVWVSEIALQQTRVEQGTPYIERFLNAFPNVETLAEADADQVLKLWEGLGYYTRARNLHKAARQVVRDRRGVLPKTAGDWQGLPGVGRYTAGAIASIAYGEAVPVLDGNVKRVLARLTDLADVIDTAEADSALWDLMRFLVQGRHPGDFNQGMMELGAQVCMPRRPCCGECPVQPLCEAYERGTQDKRPVRAAKRAVPHHEIVVAAIRKHGRYLLGKRPPNGLLGGLWEFPGGKVEPGENHVAAVQREVKEELGIDVDVGGFVARVNHAYSHFKVTLNVYRCSAGNGTPRPSSHTELKWVAPKDFSRYAFPKANHKFLNLL